MVLDTGVKTPRYAHIKPILETNQDKIAPEDAHADSDAVGYVRGANYYGGI